LFKVEGQIENHSRKITTFPQEHPLLHFEIPRFMHVRSINYDFFGLKSNVLFQDPLQIYIPSPKYLYSDKKCYPYDGLLFKLKKL
jgi:hypothetical protein